MSASDLKPAPPLKICCLVPYPLDTTPSQRFRLEQWAPQLRRAGIGMDFAPFVDEKLMRSLPQPGGFAAKAAALGLAFLRRAARVASLRRYDLIVIHRAACIAGPAVLERAISLLRRPVVFDFDDAIYLLHTSAANRRFGWLKFPGKTAAICRLSSHVVVGNSYLAEYAGAYNRAVTVVPTSIDTDRYRPLPPRSGGPVVVGWSGSSTSQTYLEQFAPVFRELLRQPGVELRVVSNRAPDMPGVPFIWRPWSPETEVQEIGQFDVGVMPMPDDQWSLGKCALKALQYMAMGVPAVCSAVGANREVIQHGQNGLLATTPDEWLSHLRTLIADEELRRRLGQAGRCTIEQGYSTAICAEKFARVIRQTLP